MRRILAILVALTTACSNSSDPGDPSLDASVCPPAHPAVSARTAIDAGPANTEPFVDAGTELHTHDSGFRHAHTDAGSATPPDEPPDHGDAIKDRCWPLTPDWVPHQCLHSNWRRPACAAPVTADVPEISFNHLELPTAIDYEHHPPSSGDHRPQWALWGEYGFLPPQRWLHNAEHGGIILLYHPCASPQTIDALRVFAQTRPLDSDNQPFRYILTPYPDLEGEVGAVAWTHTVVMSCYDPATLGAFVDTYHRQAPEDVSADGDYSFDWIGR
jgi:hypothetical protein